MAMRADFVVDLEQYLHLSSSYVYEDGLETVNIDLAWHLQLTYQRSPRIQVSPVAFKN